MSLPPWSSSLNCRDAQNAYGSDYIKLQELLTQQQSIETALEEKTERWMYLQELKEQIDAQKCSE